MNTSLLLSRLNAPRNPGPRNPDPGCFPPQSPTAHTRRPGLPHRPPASRSRFGINWRIGYLLILLTLPAGMLPAQRPVLDEYVRQGLESNLALQARDLQVAQSLSRLEQARAAFFPKIAFNANYTLARGGRSISIPVGDLLNPVYSTLNQLTQSDAFPQLENVEEQFLPHNFQETKLSLSQPLFNSDVYFGYKARQAQVEVEKAKQAAYAQSLAHEIRIAYFRYLQAAEAISIYENVRLVLLEVRRVNERLVSHQKATPDVLATAEAEIARLDQQLAEAHKDSTLAAAWFNFLLNRETDAEILRDSLWQPATGTLATYPELAAQAEAGRQELQALRMGIRASETLADMKRYDAILPDLYVAAQAGFQGFGYDFGDGQEFWLAQVGLTWDLFQGRGKQAAREEARIQVAMLENEYQSLVRQLQLQVLQAREGLRAAETALIAAETERKAAAQAFRLIHRRHEEGQAMLLELLRARDQLTSAQIAHNIARYRVAIQLSELNKAVAAQ